MTNAQVNSVILSGRTLTTLDGTLIYDEWPYQVWTFPDDDYALLLVYNPKHRHYRIKAWYSSPDDCIAAIPGPIFQH